MILTHGRYGVSTRHLSLQRSILASLGDGCIGVIRYLFILATVAGCFVVFELLNRLSVIGKQNARLKPNVWMVTNHQSLIDSFVLGYAVCFPSVIWRPTLLPWHLPDRVNFFATPLLRLLMRLWKAIPVEREVADATRRNISANYAILRALKTGVVHIFIERKRAPTREMLPPKPEVARLILRTSAAVLPVSIDGMHDIQPYRTREEKHTNLLSVFGKRFAWIFHFRIFQKVVVNVGPIIEHDELVALAGEGTEAERAERLATELGNRIRQLKDSAATRLKSAA